MKEEALRTITFTEEEYKLLINALMLLRNNYLDNEFIKDDVNLIIEKVINSKIKRKQLFKNLEVR